MYAILRRERGIIYKIIFENFPLFFKQCICIINVIAYTHTQFT